MRNRTIEIADRAGHIFKMEIATERNIGRALNRVDVDLPLTGMPNDDGVVGHMKIEGTAFGHWRVVDKGYLKFNNGKTADRRPRALDITSRDLILTNLDGTWGMMLWDYEGYYGVKDDGIGMVAQPWVVQMQAGKFSWTVLD